MDINSTPIPSSSTRPIPPSKLYSRIYIPTPFKSKNRISSTSTRSFESLPENEQANFKSHNHSPIAFPLSNTPSNSNSSSHSHSHSHHHQRKRQSSGKYNVQKKERAEKRWRAILELLETERVYVKDLEIIYNFFVLPLRQSGDESLINQLFPHFQHILNTNKELLRSIECAVLPGLPPIPAQTTTDTNPTTVTTFNSLKSSTTVTESQQPLSPSASSVSSFGSNNSNHRDHYLKTRANIQLAPTLLNLVPFLKLYTPFIRNFENSQRQLNTHLRNKLDFATFVRNAQRTIVETNQGGTEWIRLGLNSKLLAIVQRVPRYKLLLGQILKYTDETTEEFENLQRALKLVSEVANTFESHIAQHQHTLSLLTLQKSIFGLPFPLISPGRTHVKSGWLVKIGRKREEVRAFFLLNDCLIYASPTTSSSVGSVVGELVNVVNPTISPPTTPSITEFKQSPFTSNYNRQNSSNRLSLLGLPSANNSYTQINTKLGNNSVNISHRRGHKHSTSLPVNFLPPPSSISSIASDDEQNLTSSTTSSSRLLGPIDIGSLNQCFQFNRKLDLEDVTVVAIDNDYPQSLGRTFQIISSEKSFSVYAESEEERNSWLDIIRSTKDNYLSAFRTLKIDENQFPLDPDCYIRKRGSSTNTTINNPLRSPSLSFSNAFNNQLRLNNVDNRTASHRLRRRSVHAYAEVPTNKNKGRERTKSAFATEMSAAAAATAIVNGLRRNKQDNVNEEIKDDKNDNKPSETKLRVLEHYAAPIWVPDSKTFVCMSCTQPFNWMRRKHHCRMCGNVVCHECSTRNFLIVNDDNGERQLARACDGCYEGAFPTTSGGEETEEEIMNDDNNNNNNTNVENDDMFTWTRSTSSTSLHRIMMNQSQLTIGEGSKREPSLSRSSYATSTSSIASGCPSASSSPPTTALTGQNVLYSPPKPQSPKLRESGNMSGFLTPMNNDINSGFKTNNQSVITSTSDNKQYHNKLGVGKRKNLIAPRITTPKNQQYRHYNI